MRSRILTLLAIGALIILALLTWVTAKKLGRQGSEAVLWAMIVAMRLYGVVVSVQWAREPES